MKPIPQWRKKAIAKYRKALRASGHTTFASAMKEFEKVLVKHCYGKEIPTETGRLDELQNIRRYRMQMNPKYHQAMEASNRSIRKTDKIIANVMAALKKLGIKV